MFLESHAKEKERGGLMAMKLVRVCVLIYFRLEAKTLHCAIVFSLPRELED